MSAVARASSPVSDVRPNGRGVVLLDPGLFFEGGHHATLARLVCRESDRRGMFAEVFGAGRIDRPPPGIAIRRHFRTSAYAPLSRWDPADSLRVLNDEVYEDARGLNLMELNDASVIVMPTLTSRIALGLARWVSELPDWFVPRVAAVFMFQPGWAGDDRLREAELAVYREAIALLQSATPGRVAMFAETGPIGRLFERLGADEIRELPWPATVPEGPPRLAFESSSMEPLVSLLGYSKIERGFGHMPGVIRRVRRTAPATRFAVQVHAWNDPAVDRAAAELRSMAGVRTLEGAMPPELYGERMRESDIVLLPYDPRAYRDRGSGILGEAASCGRIVVCPEGTWIADQAREWGLAAVLFEAFEPESIGDAVAEAVGRRIELLDVAERAAEAWRLERSPQAFLDRLLMPAADRPIKRGRAPMTVTTAPSRTSQPPAEPAARAKGDGEDRRHLIDGLWTPQTQMLRELEDWILAQDEEIGSALSIDRNPTIDDMLTARWPGIRIERARYPEVDVQDLSVYPDGTFDMTYSHQVLEHVPKPWVAAAELVRVLRPGGIGLHTTCAANPRHGPPVFNDYYRFLPDGLEQLFDGVDVLVKASWGNRQALAYNYAIDDGHGALGGRRFGRAIGEPNEENFPWHTWIIFRKR